MAPARPMVSDEGGFDDELFAPGYEVGVDARAALLLVARPAG